MVLEQLESYDNLILPVVECFKYLGPLSFDVLIFVLLDQLSCPRGSAKTKVQRRSN